MVRKAGSVLASGFVGAVAWYFSMIAFFGPAQAILTDPRLQSAKFIAAFQTLEPLPRITGHALLMFAGCLAICVVYAIVHQCVRASLSGPLFQRSFKFGFLLWAVMVPWFEFYLPWNVMHEPALLVALECVCWFAVMQSVALAIVGTESFVTGKR
jgi:hypothetical protein